MLSIFFLYAYENVQSLYKWAAIKTELKIFISWISLLLWKSLNELIGPGTSQLQSFRI
jgi:hypothetical protein